MRIQRMAAATLVVAAAFRRRGRCAADRSGRTFRPACCSSRSAPLVKRSIPPSRDGDRTRTAATSCCSATSTATRKRSTCRSDPTIGSNRAVPTSASRRISMSGRQWGVFAITVPKDFGTKKLTWTLTANGHTSTVQFWLNPPYWIDFYKNGANGNEPPRIKFSPDGAGVDRPAAREVRADVDRDRRSAARSHRVGRGSTADDDVSREGARRRRGSGRAAADRARRPPTNRSRRSSAAASLAGTPAAPGGGGAAAAAREKRGDIQVLWKKYRGPGEVKIARRRSTSRTAATRRSLSRRRPRRRSARPAPTGCARR